MENYSITPHPVGNYSILPLTMQNYSILPLTVENYSILPLTVENYSILPFTVENYSNLSVPMGTYSTLRVRTASRSPFYITILKQGLLRALKWVLWPLSVLLGVFGNVMTLTIVHRLRTRRSSLDPYFMALAMADLCFLFARPFALWVDMIIGFPVSSLHDAICKLGNFAMNASAGISAWIVVVMTTQRALSVVWPHRVNALCTQSRSWKMILVIVVLFCLTYSHMLYGFRVVGTYYRRCSVISRSYELFILNVWPKIDMFIFSVVPFVCLSISNSVLIVKLRASVKSVSDQLATSDIQQASRVTSANSVTLTAIIVSLTFVFLTLPLALYNTVIFAIGRSHTSETRDLLIFIGNIVYYLGDINFCINFYLYCLTGKKFRNEFKIIFCGWLERLTRACRR